MAAFTIQSVCTLLATGALLFVAFASGELDQRERRQYFDSLGGMALGDKRAAGPATYSFDSLGGMALGEKRAVRSPAYAGLYFRNPAARSFYLEQLKGSDDKRIVDSLAGDYLIKKKRSTN